MQDLRVHSVDGDYLVLQGSDGASYRVLIDDDLRRAARREAITDSDAAIISPRDIQLEIRAGFSIDELAAKTGASVEYIQKFAAPVIDELAHVVSSALAVRITIAGDRYNDTAQVEFGELISNRLAAMGVAQFSWSSKRTDNGGWQLNCRFDDSVAAWAFDPRKLSLSPENELAVQLSTQQTVTDGPIPKLRPVLDTPTKSQPAVAVEPQVKPVEVKVEAPTAPNPMILPTPAIPVAQATAVSNETKNVTADLGTTADFDGVIPFGRTVPTKAVPAPTEQDDLTNTADLLEALRRKRLSREQELAAEEAAAAAAAQAAAEETQELVEAAQELENDEPESVDTKPNPVVPEPASPAKKGRSPMPSWDEIVFGTKTDD